MSAWQFHPAAAQDLSEAARFYRREGGAALSRRFLAEVERTLALLADQAELGTPLDEERRSFPQRSFPYLLIYRALGQERRVLVVRHQHRDPDFGEQRRP